MINNFFKKIIACVFCALLVFSRCNALDKSSFVSKKFAKSVGSVSGYMLGMFGFGKIIYDVLLNINIKSDRIKELNAKIEMFDVIINNCTEYNQQVKILNDANLNYRKKNSDLNDNSNFLNNHKVNLQLLDDYAKGVAQCCVDLCGMDDKSVNNVVTIFLACTPNSNEKEGNILSVMHSLLVHKLCMLNGNKVFDELDRMIGFIVRGANDPKIVNKMGNIENQKGNLASYIKYNILWNVISSASASENNYNFIGSSGKYELDKKKYANYILKSITNYIEGKVDYDSLDAFDANNEKMCYMDKLKQLQHLIKCVKTN